MTGKIKRLITNRRHGFIERDGQDDLFFSFDDLSNWKQAKEGDTVEFEEGVDDQDRPRAINISITSSSSANKRDSKGKDKDDKSKSAPTHPPAAAFIIGQPEPAVESVNGIDFARWELPVTVVFKRTDKGKEVPLPGVEVTLTADGIDVAEPVRNPRTSPEGAAFFRVVLNHDTARCDLLATVHNADGTYDRFTQHWKHEPIKAKVISAKFLGASGEVSLFRVFTGVTDDRGMAAEVTATSSIQLSVSLADKPSETLPVGNEVGFATDDKGSRTVLVRMESGSHGEVFFFLKGTNTCGGPFPLRRNPGGSPSGTPSKGDLRL